MISEGSGMQALSIAIIKMTPPYPKDAMVAMMNVDTAVKILSLMLGQSRGEPRLRHSHLRVRPAFETER